VDRVLPAGRVGNPSYYGQNPTHREGEEIIVGSLRERIALLCSAGVLACLAVGCGRSDGLDKLIPVKGKILFTGQPIPSASSCTVILKPDVDQGNTTPHEPRGVMDKDGNFQVFTANRAGAPPGHYKVAVIVMESPPPDSKNPYAPPKWLIDQKYGDPATSGLKLNVVDNAPEGAFDLTIAN
jgi:hypothetical protein